MYQNELNRDGAITTIQNLLPNAKMVIAFDNDTKGAEYSKTIEKLIIDEFKKMPSMYKPFCKDCNDDLRLIKKMNLGDKDKEFRLENLNREDFEKKMDYIIYRYHISKGINRSNLLKRIRDIDKLKPLSQELREKFNQLSKHKSIREL